MICTLCGCRIVMQRASLESVSRDLERCNALHIVWAPNSVILQSPREMVLLELNAVSRGGLGYTVAQSCDSSLSQKRSCTSESFAVPYQWPSRGCRAGGKAKRAFHRSLIQGVQPCLRSGLTGSGYQNPQGRGCTELCWSSPVSDCLCSSYNLEYIGWWEGGKYDPSNFIFRSFVHSLLLHNVGGLSFVFCD